MIDTRPVALELGRWLARNSVGRRLRSMREFAEQEFILPDGPAINKKFKVTRQPYTALWLDAVDSGQWKRIVTTGPTQSGKTVIAFVIPTMYHLFEIGETVICGVPQMEMAADKWAVDLLPAIEASRYRDLLPTKGASARGGTRAESIRFKNGVTLKFMTAGGGDKKRAAFTSRVLIVTETDGFDEKGGTSRETTKLRQLYGRVKAWGSRAKIYEECTVSTESGHTWREYQESTQSKIVRPCPHCNVWVTPEREDLVGWKDATSEHEAKAKSSWHCPKCGEAWTEQERYAANLKAKLVHKGQECTEDGQIVGAAPQTDTLGFRWSAIDNHFVTAGDIGIDEFKSLRSDESEATELELRQQTWCLPALDEKEDLTRIDPFLIIMRGNRSALEKAGLPTLPRGVVPSDAQFITVGIDIRTYWGDWVAIAWRDHASPHVLDYGEFNIPTLGEGLEHAILFALHQFRDSVCETGWPTGNNEERMKPSCVLIDANWRGEPVHQFCAASQKVRQNVYWASMGLGQSQDQRRSYTRPKLGGDIIAVGEEYHVKNLNGHPIVQMSSDYWKTWWHDRLSTPFDKQGAVTLFVGDTATHLAFAKHQCAEKPEREFDRERGKVIKRWFKNSQENHKLDAAYGACVAGHWCGARLIQPVVVEVPKRKPAQAMTRPDGRGWFER